MTPTYNLVAIIGPTATGKTSFAALLAAMTGGEVISADSRQVYRRMNLGTGKDYNDYRVNEVLVPVHLIDIAEPGYKYSVFEYQRDFFRVFSDIRNRGLLPVLCGGSGMYIHAVLQGYRLIEVPRNEELRNNLKDKSLEELQQLITSMRTVHNTTDTGTPERAIRAIEIENFYLNSSRKSYLPTVNPLVIGLSYERTIERARITERLEARMKHGLVDEVKHLIESGIPPETLLYYGLEYRYVTQYLKGELDYDTMFSKLNTAIQQFAKRQRTWFRKMEREGVAIHWINGELPPAKKLDLVLKLLYPGDLRD